MSASLLDANNADSQGVTYALESTAAGEAAVSGYTGTGGAIVIPSTVTDTNSAVYSVVKINEGALNGKSITSLSFPDTLLYIGFFSSCGNNLFTTLTIPSSVTFIGNSAFSDCANLTTIVCNTGPSAIIDGTWINRNYNLTSITFPNNLNFVTDTSNGCNYIKKNNNTELELVWVPLNVVSLLIPSTLSNLQVTSIGNYAFYLCTSLASVTIPDAVTSIGNGAFHSCTALTSVTIPDSVTSIGPEAFASCSGLTSVTIPDDVTSIGDAAFSSCSSLTSVTIPDDVTSIGANTFHSCTALTSVTIPDAVTSIGILAFYRCSSLTSVTIGANVTSISNDVFQQCSSLTSVTIPDSVTSIGYGAFNSCSALTSVTIPDDVTSIGDAAFYQCSSLTSVTIPDAVTSIGNHVFNSCTALTSVTIPDAVTSIGNHAFQQCSSLISVTIPDAVTSIGYMAFYGCNQLSTVIFLGDYDTTLNGEGNVNGYINLFYNSRFQRTGTDSSTDPSTFATLYYAEGASGWETITESPNNAYSHFPFQVPPQILKTYSEYMNLASGAVIIPHNGQIDNVSGGTVFVENGTANINSTSGVFDMNLNTGNANVVELNGSSSASVSIGSGRSLNTTIGVFSGTLSGAGTLGKTGTDTLTLPGDNTGFSGIISVMEGTIRVNQGSALGTGIVKLQASASESATLEILTTVPVTLVNLIEATSNSTNKVTNVGTAAVTFTGGMIKDGSTMYLESQSGKIIVDSNISGSSSNSDLEMSGDVTLVAGNTYEFNGPTTVTTGTLTLENGVSLPNSDVTINSGATLVLEYTSTTISANTVKSLTLNTTCSFIINMSSDLDIGDYTVMNTSNNGISEQQLLLSALPVNATVNYTGSNSYTATLQKLVNTYVVTIADNSTPDPEPEPEPTPTSNICFPAKTPVLTNCGYVNIEEIDAAVHTIRNKKIVAITKTVAHDKNLVRIAKHALGKNYPEKTTFISQNHKVFCQGQMIKAKHLVNETTVTLVPYNGAILYNVLLADHEKMQVNNLIVETLHPEHKVAKLYRFLKNVDVAHHGKLIAAFNKKDKEHRR